MVGRVERPGLKGLDRKSNFLGLGPEDAEPERAGVVILPVPYERTSSYVMGCFRGPQAILEASPQLEYYDEELDCEIYRLCGGIATLEPLDLFAETTGPAVVEKVRQTVASLLEKGKFVVCLGGEHTSSLGAIRACRDRGDGKLSLLQLDAHSDLRDSYLGDPYSHASVMARALEFVPRLVQVGIRSQDAQELAHPARDRVQTFYAHAIKTGKMPDWQERVLDALSDRVYITIDADFFDPSVVPAVSTPEPGGFLWYETLELLRKVTAAKDVVGFDICEFCPVDGLHYPDFTLARLLYKLIGYVWLKRV
ncbi:MAG: agmatinase [bacterium]